MQAERQDSGDWYYIVRNDQGIAICSTSLSKGAKHTLGPNRVSQMARQLYLNRPQLLIDLVSCSLKREEALKIIEANCSPGQFRQRR